MIKSVTNESLHDIYRDISNLVGYENMLKIYDYYKGQQINFPVKLSSAEYLHTKLMQEYDGKNAKQLAKETGYSERWVRQLVKQNIGEDL